MLDRNLAPSSYQPERTLLLPLSDVAARLNVSRSAVQRLVRAGELRTVQIGRSRRVASADLDAFVQHLRAEAGHR